MEMPSLLTPADPMATQLPILIVGAGQAGAMAAATLRQMGYDGRITMVGDELHAPYERPPLSKSVLSTNNEEVALRIHPETFYEEQGIDLKLGCHVVSIDTHERFASLGNGELIKFSSCLFATGGQARILPALPQGLCNIHYLRSIDDAKKLRCAMKTSRALLIIGGGFIGLETASTARSMGLNVMVVESGHQLLTRAVPAQFSTWLVRRAEAFGVQLHLGDALKQVKTSDQKIEVELVSGKLLEADITLVSIGLSPNVNLARQAGIEIDSSTGGIRIDSNGRTSVPHIYAAGDCASQFQPIFAREVRLESWQSANEQARLAAAAMIEAETAPAAMPWFWTDQFECNIQMLGAFDPSLAYCARGQLPNGKEQAKFLLFGISSGKLRHVIAVNSGGNLRQFRAVLETSAYVPVNELSDVSIPLRKTVQATLTNITL